MSKLSTTYLGLELKNPIIISSCSLTSNLKQIRQMEEAGAGAIVLKSLFEEQINNEILHLDNYGNDYPEAADYINTYVNDNRIQDYLNLVSGAKKECHIPIIASINCSREGKWVEFAREIQRAGADALELNVFFLPTGKETTSDQLEAQYLSVIEKVVPQISIPVSVKLSNHFTNPIRMADELYFRGVKGVVMFNRFYEPDIDIHTLEVKASNILSEPSEMRNTIRWVGMASSAVPGLDYSASTGIYDGESIIKLLLAGARTVQICSAVYKQGPQVIEQMLCDLEKWMCEKCYDSLHDFRGKLSYGNTPLNIAYERAQFMKFFASK